MKKIILGLIIPITVISFFTITKWWYILPVDGTDSMFYGFPFIYCGNGWNTSMAIQFFALELIIDLIVYFIFWLLIFFIFNKYFLKIKPNKSLIVILWTITSFYIFFFITIGSMSENSIYVKRWFKMEKMDSGIKFIWQQTDRPNFYKYHPQKSK